MNKIAPLFITALMLIGMSTWAGLPEQALELATLHAQLQDAQTDEARMTADSTFASLLQEVISQKESFDYPFDELKYIYKGKSPDDKFRLYNWNIPLQNGDHNYRCFVQFFGRDGSTQVVELTKAKRPHRKPEMATLKEDSWLPALYYEIIPIKKGSGTVYTLLGWDGKDRYINRKIIDVLQFQGSKIRFGASIFKMKMGMKKRLIFEYADEVSMSLRYHAKEKEIIYDHLSPRQPGLEGNPAFYGPDLSFDSLTWKKGKWLLKEDIEVTQARDKGRRRYNDPSKR